MKRRVSEMKMKGLGSVILFPLPFQGHINPMLQLANVLHQRGFSISIIHTHFNSPNASNYPHFRFYPIPDGLPENYVVSSDFNHIVTFIKYLNSNCQSPFRDCLAKLISTSLEDEDPIVCLVTDVLWHCTQSVANGLQIPRIVLRTSNVAAFFVTASMPSLYQKGYLPLQDSQAEDQIPELPEFRLKDISMSKAIDRGSLLEFIDIVVKETKASSGVIYNSCEDLEEEYLSKFSLCFQIPVFLIGPFHKYFPASSSSLLPQDRTCISWLDKQKPNSVIYVSFGSVASINETNFLEVAWGLANSKQPFLWVVRPGLVEGSEWLELLPNGFLEMVGERGHIVKWAPQQEVLAHPSTGAFWTHCGWNSTLESLCEGVPMICQPSFGDQKTDARFISHLWRVGVHLEFQIERGEIEKAIKRLMVEPEGQEMRDRIELLKDKMDLCLKPGGSSYKALDNLMSGNQRNKGKMVEDSGRKKKSKVTAQQFQYAQRSVMINEERASQRASQQRASQRAEQEKKERESSESPELEEESSSSDYCGDKEARVAVPDAVHMGSSGTRHRGDILWG